MIKMNGRFRWRRAWLAGLCLSLALVVVFVWTIFPSRSTLEAEHLRRAAKIEAVIDQSPAKLDEVRLESRFSGISYATAVASLRDKMSRLDPASLSDAKVSSYSRQGGNSAGPHSGPDSTLVWLYGESRFTPATLAKLKVEFEQLDQSYQQKLDLLPARRLKTLACGFALVLLPMGLLFALGTALDAQSGIRGAGAHAHASAGPSNSTIAGTLTRVRALQCRRLAAASTGTGCHSHRRAFASFRGFGFLAQLPEKQTLTLDDIRG